MADHALVSTQTTQQTVEHKKLGEDEDLKAWLEDERVVIHTTSLFELQNSRELREFLKAHPQLQFLSMPVYIEEPYGPWEGTISFSENNYTIDLDNGPFYFTEIEFPNLGDWVTPAGQDQYYAFQNKLKIQREVPVSDFVAPEGTIMYVIREAVVDTLLYRVIQGQTRLISYTDFHDELNEPDHEGNPLEQRMVRFTKSHVAYNIYGKTRNEILITYDLIFVPDIWGFSNIQPLELPENEEEYIYQPNERPLSAQITHEHKPNYRRVKAIQEKNDFDSPENELVLLLALFDQEEQVLLKNDFKLLWYLSIAFSSEEMARAIGPYDTQIFTVEQKLQQIRLAQPNVDYSAVRPILRQHPIGLDFDALATQSEKYVGTDNISVRRLINYVSGKHRLPKYWRAKANQQYDDLTDESIGAVGVRSDDFNALIDELNRLQAVHAAIQQEDEAVTQTALKAAGFSSEGNFEDEFEPLAEEFLQFFRDNALKKAFQILDMSEQVIKQELEDYRSGEKLLQLERDLTAMSHYFENMEFASPKHNDSQLERIAAPPIYEKNSQKVRDFLAARHPYLFELEGPVLDVYLMYRNDP